LFIIRHGATAGNEAGVVVGHQDLPLSARGRRQAQSLSRRLADWPLQLALTSPLERAGATARLALTGRDVPLERDRRLTELDLQGWEGKSRGALRGDPAWEAWLRTPHRVATPAGERLCLVQRRVGQALRDGLSRLELGQGLALFTHGGVARVLILELLGLPLSCYQKVRCDCGSVTSLAVDQGGNLLELRGLNITESL
jgi:broad specificity phosphatase PhoE